jgi:AcrR family transcriptional regulator
MKISKEKKIQVKKKIISCAVDLISVHGYKKTSMSKIAKKAKIGEATIYNYFPTKEHILFEYYYELQLETKTILLKTKGFNEFSLKEQLQLLINTQLELLSNNRTFILEIYEEIFYKTFTHPAMTKGNDELLLMIQELLDIAIEAKEIEPIPFSNTILNLGSDYIFGVIYYWIHDESENFDNTTIMIDKSLELIYAILQSGLINKIEDLLSFIIKTHILQNSKQRNVLKKRAFGI